MDGAMKCFLKHLEICMFLEFLTRATLRGLIVSDYNLQIAISEAIGA